MLFADFVGLLQCVFYKMPLIECMFCFYETLYFKMSGVYFFNRIFLLEIF